MTDIITALSVEDVYPNPKHYREVRDKDVSALADSMDVIGQLSPITVYRDGDIYIVDSGHHRLAAAKLLGWNEINAVILSDIDDARSASVMVASNMHVPETEIEKSRGAQLMISTGVRPQDASAHLGIDVSKAARGMTIAKDYAEDMSLDRLAALSEFEGDEEACKRIMTTPEAQWRNVYESLRREKHVAVAVEAAKAIIAEAGCELLEDRWNHGLDISQLAASDEAPEGATHAYITTYTWNASVDIHWFGPAVEVKDDPEEAARREQAEKLRTELKEQEARRLIFIGDHLRNNGPTTLSNDLRKYAECAWEQGAEARAGNIEEAMGEITGLVPRFYAAVLSKRASLASMAFAQPDGWYGREYADIASALIDAMVAVGYEVSETERALLDLMNAKDVDPCEECSEESDEACAECEHGDAS